MFPTESRGISQVRSCTYLSVYQQPDYHFDHAVLLEVRYIQCSDVQTHYKSALVYAT